ncbi:hypothetical protein HRI_005082500 [Hibiscus trionum]|uniref:Uncharacterized protein n=1 Tax=Hibiscus trionum TaxID=183268 RepID=A0A9W7JGC4_HIBTR|nr:hypothetical protein HRI_005082500 [Hibiscus trionum]
MGAKHSRPKRESKASKFSTRKPSIVEAIKPRCLRTRQTKNNGIKRLSQLPEAKITKVRKLTLEDWLLAAPGNPVGMKGYLNAGELHVFKHFSSKVHPSPLGEITGNDDGLFVDLSSAAVSGSSLSEKSKKKVSFRLPEEADIRIFYSSQ